MKTITLYKNGLYIKIQLSMKESHEISIVRWQKTESKDSADESKNRNKETYITQKQRPK